MSGGTRIRLRVSPGGRRTEIIGRHGEAWKLRVREAAEGGRANDAVVRAVAAAVAAPASAVRLVAGRASRDKVIEVAGIPPDEIDRRFAAASGEESTG